MALTQLMNTLRIRRDGMTATAEFNYDLFSDIPALGADAAWVEGASKNWAVADRVQLPKRYGDTSLNRVLLTARRAGLNWTWVGLQPIVRVGTAAYDTSWFLDYRSAENRWETKRGFWDTFANWNRANDWYVSAAAPVMTGGGSWEIEWLDTARRSDFLGKVNPAEQDPYDNTQSAWPADWSSYLQTVAASTYHCTHLEIETEYRINDTDPANLDTYYRHYGTFVAAPIIGGTQMTWLQTTQWGTLDLS